MLPYIKPYTFRTILAFAICIPVGGCDAVIAMALKPYTDLVMVEKSIRAAWYIPFAIVIFAIIQGILNYYASYLNTWVGERITRDLKLELYKKLLSHDAAFFDKTYSGNIVTNFSNLVDTASSGLFTKIKTIISKLASSISLICVLFYNSWELSIVAIIVLGCAFLPTAKIRQKMQDVMSKVIKGSAMLITEYNESCAGNKVITSYNLHKYQQIKFSSAINSVTQIRVKLIQKTAWLSPAMHVITSIGIGISIAYGSHLIVSKQMTSGSFVSFLTALLLLYNPLKNLGNSIKDFQMSMIAVESVLSSLNADVNIKDKKNAIELKEFKSGIVFRDVDFGYSPNCLVLESFSIEIKKGETVAFVGSSGSGKSTIANLIPRFYEINSGSIEIDGIDIRNYTLKSLRDGISVVFQDNFLFAGTIRENIVLGRDVSDNELQKAVEMACLSEFVSTLNNGLDTEIRERGLRLSGGQKQRVAIARAFLKNTPIIILDEATSSLDNEAEAIVQKAIDNLMIDRTVVIVAHRLSTIKNANRIAVINEGKLVELGPHEELMNIKNGRYKSLYEI
jgi:subfamily B ATP-binding cassette protein MsbA